MPCPKFSFILRLGCDTYHPRKVKTLIFFRKGEEERLKTGQELADLRNAIHQAHLPPEVLAVALKELERVEKTDPGVA